MRTNYDLLVRNINITLATGYFVIGGVIYIYSTFDPNNHKWIEWISQSDLVIYDDGTIVKNRGSINIRKITEELRKVIKDGLDVYDQSFPELKFVLLKEEQFNSYDPQYFQLQRQLAQSVLNLYK